MRKLRDDILEREAYEWAVRCDYSTRDALSDLYHRVRRSDYPNSFYETPEIGSFGKFWAPNHSERFGYYTGPGPGKDFPYSCSDGLVYQTFTPGLPTDVNADGSPK